MAASIRPHSACMRWSAVSSALTGRKVPAPTWSVSVAWPMPGRVERRHQRGREVQRGGRRGDRARFARRTSSGNRRRRAHRRRACRRYRAAAASARRAPAAARPARRRRRRARSCRPRRARRRSPRRRAPKSIRVALAHAAWRCGRRRASARGPSRLCSVAPIRASPRRPSSCAGMTRVSLNTSRSPARSRPRQIARRWRSRGRRAVEHQHPRGVARRRRAQRDALRRQVEIEQVDAHRGGRQRRRLAWRLGAGASAPRRHRRPRCAAPRRRPARPSRARRRSPCRRRGGLRRALGGHRRIDRLRRGGIGGGRGGIAARGRARRRRRTSSLPIEARTILDGLAGGSPRSIAST